MKSKLLFPPKSFKNKIIMYNLIIIVCIASVISLYNYNSYRKDVIESEIKSSAFRVNTLSDRLQLAYDEMVVILLNCTERKNIFPYNSSSDLLTTSATQSTLYSANVLKNYCAISGYGDSIAKIVVYTKDSQFLQAGYLPGSSTDVQAIMDADWFFPCLEQSDYLLTLVDSPFSSSDIYDKKIMPFVRPFNSWSTKSKEDSWVFIGLSPKIFYSDMNKIEPDSILYAATKSGNGGIIASQNSEGYEVDELIDNLLSLPDNHGSFITSLNNESCAVAYRKQANSGLLFFELLPLSRIEMNHNTIISTILLIFLFCIGIGYALSFFICNQLGFPIKRLLARLSIITNGNFERDYSIETDDEMGSIGKQINQMSSHISDLMETRIQGEKEKRDLEIKMLQAQINPHFLYNTLDSIKWIAIMQKNTGIVQVVTALSSLLKNMAKGFNEKVTLRQELDFLHDYVTIEKIRYIELFDLEINVESEALYQAKIIKLTLQPIVENAIFNGIEPSGCSGLIKIHVFSKSGVLFLTVTDNGVGISPENIEKLLTDTSRVTRSNMSGIGLPNVDRRIKLVYGESYGITIDSVVGQYTTITISLPLEI